MDRRAIPQFFHQFDARHRIVLACATALAVFLALQHRVRFASLILATWDSFALVSLGLAWVIILTAGEDHIREQARAQDLGRKFIFIFLLLAACGSLSAVALLLGNAKEAEKSHLGWHVGLAMVSIVSSWLLLHTVFALRYAHAFYGDRENDGDMVPAGGLDFPGDEKPDYVDFAYFSVVIGMACQVSDVQISSKAMRRLCLAHSMISFGFNTVILALTINIVSGLL